MVKEETAMGISDDNIDKATLTTTSKDENGATVETNEAIHYTYDDKEQLISAETSSIKYEYTYDDRGNILTKKEYSISLDENNQKVYTLIETNTDTYVYDATWKDKLISYNGQSITYDAVGNPTNYMGNALTWTMGRQLATFGDISYTYNEDGIRTSKTSNGVTTKFLLDGYNVIEQTDGTTTLHFFYDSNGEVIGFRYNGNDYFYVKNAMSDIVAVTDSNKNIVAEYRYDPWGKVLNEDNLTAIGNLNPFRYRSYYYDSDIQMYYLQSRYYDAETGRFLNADDVDYIGYSGEQLSYNSFAYCENNPVNCVDYSGHYYFTCSSSISMTKLYQTIFQKSKIVSSTAKKMFLKPKKKIKNDGYLYSYNVSGYNFYVNKMLTGKHRVGTLTRTVEWLLFMTYEEWLLYLSVNNYNIITDLKDKFEKVLGKTGYKIATKSLEKLMKSKTRIPVESLSKVLEMAEILVSMYYEILDPQFRYISKIIYNKINRKYKNEKYFIVIALCNYKQKQDLRSTPGHKQVFVWKTIKTIKYY